jgi:hypothetical protein
MLPVWGESEKNQEDPEIDVSAVEMFLPNCLISLIVDMSNKYALQRNKDLHVTLEEMNSLQTYFLVDMYPCHVMKCFGRRHLRWSPLQLTACVSLDFV